MKSLLLTIALLLIPQCLSQNSQQVILSWTDGQDNPGFASTCSSNVSKNCLTGISISDVTHTPVILANDIPFDSFSWTLTNFPSAGTHNYSITLSGYDSNGKLITSSPLSTSLVVPLIIEVYPKVVRPLNPEP